MNADLQFKCVQNEIEGIKVDIVDADDYAEMIERAIRAVKENIRSLIQVTLYRRMIRLITKRVVEVAT